jgi:hypothetical protein
VAVKGSLNGYANQPIVLAAVEVEFTHKFDFIKALICKSLGFPLVSLDITDTQEEQINSKWAKAALIETTRNSQDGLRRNYIYIHRLLSTLYIDIPREIVPESRHQYVIFTPQQKTLISYLETLRKLLKLDKKQAVISPVTIKNEQLRVQVQNAGNLAGEEWQAHNKEGYIQLTVDKPCSKAGNLYYFHLILAKLCNSDLDCLVGYVTVQTPSPARSPGNQKSVSYDCRGRDFEGGSERLLGYKYELGHVHKIGEPLMWHTTRKINGELVRYKIAPKRVSEPIVRILSHVE